MDIFWIVVVVVSAAIVIHHVVDEIILDRIEELSEGGES